MAGNQTTEVRARLVAFDMREFNPVPHQAWCLNTRHLHHGAQHWIAMQARAAFWALWISCLKPSKAQYLCRGVCTVNTDEQIVHSLVAQLTQEQSLSQILQVLTPSAVFWTSQIASDTSSELPEQLFHFNKGKKNKTEQPKNKQKNHTWNLMERLKLQIMSQLNILLRWSAGVLKSSPKSSCASAKNHKCVPFSCLQLQPALHISTTIHR